MSELLPCPCCGGDADIGVRFVQDAPEHFKPVGYAAVCKCGLKTKKFKTREEAAECWNLRQSNTELRRGGPETTTKTQGDPAVA